jgi:hypothetical protein
MREYELESVARPSGRVVHRLKAVPLKAGPPDDAAAGGQVRLAVTSVLPAGSAVE